MGEPRFDQSCNFNNEGFISGGHTPSAMKERSSSSFSSAEFSLGFEFGHEREVGVVIKKVDITSGEIVVNLNEELLLKKKNSSDTSSHTDRVIVPDVDPLTSVKPNKKQMAVSAFTKYSFMLPEKVCFSLPRLDIRFVHREHDLAVDNNIMGIQLKSIKSRSSEDAGESTRLDFQLEFSEIHLLRETDTSILDILKVDVVFFMCIPLQTILPVRVEIDLKLGGTQCNIIMSRLKTWLRLDFSKRKRTVLPEETSSLKRHQPTKPKAIMWTCTVSAPEVTIVVYGISGLPLFHGCSQSSHVFANNISSTGSVVQIELGELNLHMVNEDTNFTNFPVESNSDSLMHIAKVSLDRGKKDQESGKLVLLVDVTAIGVYLTFKRIEALISTAISFQALLKQLSASGKKPMQIRGGRVSKSSGKGKQLLKFNLDRCSVYFCGDMDLENTDIEDPKRVNYGSQGGKFVISVSSDGTPRTAKITSTLSDECKRLNYYVSLDIFQFKMCADKDKQSTQIELERARSIYQEYLEEHNPDAKLTLLDIQNAKFVRCSAGNKEVSVCSLFSATDITVRWEPDVHLSLFGLVLQLKALVYNEKLREAGNEHTKDVSSARDLKKDASLNSGNSDKNKKKEAVLAVDVEMLNISAEVGDGVDAVLQIQSIFSENARIGVLFEGLMLSFNGSKVFKSSRVQISRFPRASSSSCDSEVPLLIMDWAIQGLDVHICLPYRLELRAIDDSIEDMLRGLKLITAAKIKLMLPMKKESSKTKKPSTAKFGSLKFHIRRLTADIEEEPMQGWLDEHYKIMKNEARELAVRLKSLDEIISRGNQCQKCTEINDCSHERKIYYNGIETDVQDHSVILRIQEEIHKQSFQSYYQACKNLTLSEGSGACKEGFQAGFRPSTARTSLLSISATDFDIKLTKIDGGDDGMIEVIKKLDPVCLEKNIPFSRLYGSNILLHVRSLAVQLRNYTFPLFAATSGKCEGCVVLAQQATYFQPQIYQDVFIGKWRKMRMLRSASGTTPPMKTYTDLPLYFQKAEISFGVGYEPVLADVSFAFTVALRRAHLSVRNPIPPPQQPKKERNLPWWDDVRNYIHGKIILSFSETRWNILATTDPYEKLDKLQIISGDMEIQQSDGRVSLSVKDFKILLSSLESLVYSRSLKVPPDVSTPFLEAPTLTIEVLMVWECDSGDPLNHYLFALPIEGKTREIVFDPFRSTSLSLQWNLSLRPYAPLDGKHLSVTMEDSTVGNETTNCTPCKSQNVSTISPVVNIGPHDLVWLMKFWNMNYLPPHKLRSFSRWPRFGVPRFVRSGNLSLDRVMTEFMFRIDATPICINHMPLHADDPSNGLSFNVTKLKYEFCFSRGRQKFTFDCKREPLDQVYLGLDIHMPKAFLNIKDCSGVAEVVQLTRKMSQSVSMDRVSNKKSNTGCTDKQCDDGFLLSSDYFTIRRQAPKADPVRLLAWQEAGRKNLEMTHVRSEFEKVSENDEHTQSDPSDDDGYDVVIADNCLRVFIFGFKLLWTIETRNAVCSFAGGLSKAFQPPKPSPSRQYAQRKLHEEKLINCEAETSQDDISNTPISQAADSLSPSHAESSGSLSTTTPLNLSSSAIQNEKITDSEEEGNCHLMVNIIEPQFNLQAVENNDRFLLAAVSGRVLARSFHSVLRVSYEMVQQAPGNEHVHNPESEPNMTWTRTELSVMLERVQAHVAPTDVDPGAGLQWLPRIHRSSPKVNRTGALLERVFMPCDMYFQYTRHKSGSSDLKVKPLKELSFNTDNITATMTSRQFRVMLDVLTNLLFARVPKARKSILSLPAEEDEDAEEVADEVVPDGVEEVELAKVSLEQKDREHKLILDDVKQLSILCDTSVILKEKEGDLWMVTGGRSTLVHELKKELANAQRIRKEASESLRMALQKAAQQRLMEKENKCPSYAMRISLQINKVVWSMLMDGKSFAEAEINDMIYDFDRDYKDIGVAQFTTKYFIVRNCLPDAKSDVILSASNPPSNWGKKVMLRVDAKQGSPKEGNSSIELFQVEIFPIPIKIYWTESIAKILWSYLFPSEERDSQRRQEVWKVSTSAGSKIAKKGSSIFEASSSSNHFTDESKASKFQNLKENASSSASMLRRTSSFDRTWEETVAESVANELVTQVCSPKSGACSIEHPDIPSKNKAKNFKISKSGRSSNEEKKVAKPVEGKRSSPQKVIEFRNIKISQVELIITYGIVINKKLLIDTFHRAEFTGSWTKLFTRIKHHFIWGAVKSVTGMKGKKLKDKAHCQKEGSGTGVPDTDLNFSDDDGGQAGKSDQQRISWPKRPIDGAGDGFVTSIRGLFNTQRRKAKAFVLRTMKGEEDDDFQGEWSEGDVEFSPFARQLTITKAKRLIKRHTKKFHTSGQKGSSSRRRESLPSTPGETSPDWLISPPGSPSDSGYSSDSSNENFQASNLI